MRARVFASRSYSCQLRGNDRMLRRMKGIRVLQLVCLGENERNISDIFCLNTVIILFSISFVTDLLIINIF